MTQLLTKKQKIKNGNKTGHPPVVTIDISKLKVLPAINGCAAFEKSEKDILINFTDDLIWSVNCNFELVTANNAFVKYLQDSAGITVKPGDDLLNQNIFPKDYLTYWKAIYKRALVGDCFKEDNYTPALNKQKQIWTETIFNPLKEAGAIVGVACFSRNITEKKLAEEKLKQLETRLIQTQEVSKVGSWETDLSTLEVIWSEETYNIFGLDPAKFQTSHPGFLEFVHPDDRTLVDTSFANSIDGNSINKIEHRIITPAGVIKIVEERWRIFRNDDGTPAKAVGTCQDITSRKNAEEKLKESELRYRSIIEQATDAICIADASMKIIDVNHYCCQMLGYTKEEFLPLTVADLFVPEDLKENPFKFGELMSGKVIRNERRLKRKDGTLIEVEMSGRMLEDGRFILFGHDIAERKKAEDKIKESELRYRSLNEQATDTICIFDSAFKFIEINPSGCNMFGFTKEEVLQLYMTDVLFEEDLKTNPLKIDELKAGKVTSNERRIKRKDGSAILVELSSKMVEDGKIMVFGRDISERKEAERLIKESEAKYRSFFESSMDGILLKITDGEILSANPAACEIFKMTEEEICATGRSGVMDSQDPRVKLLLEERQHTGRAKGEVTMLRKDGSKFESEITSAIFIDSFGQNRTSMIVRDITKRKQAEQRIKESNERFNLISQATNDMVWDWDLVTGKVDRSIEGWKKIFRTGNKEIEKETIDDWDNRIHPDDRGVVKQVEHDIQKSEKDFFEVECRMMRDDGTYAYVHDRGNILRNEQGKAIRIIGATQDITARKEAELQVAKSELRFRSLVQNSSDLISILDEKAYYLYSSPAVKKVLGYDPDFMKGKNAFSFIHPDDIVTIKSDLSKEKTGMNFEVSAFRFKNKKGEWRWLESKITDMRDNPEVQGYVFNSRDVTERKTAEAEIEKLSFIARETTNVVIITNPEGEVVWVNEGFTKITEFELEEVVGKKPGDFLQGRETSPAVVRYMRKKLKQAIPFQCDIINYSKSGRKYWLRIQCQPQFDESGKLKYFFAIETDITKEKEAEMILKASEERYRYLFNNNPACAFIWDIENFKILEVNDTAIALYGYYREEFLTKKVFDLCRSEDYNKINQLASMARQNKEFKSEFTCQHMNKSGEEMHMHISSHLIQFKGSPVILAMAINITDKIILEHELENERRLKQQEITSAVITAQEKERQELGSELHDNINQILAGSRLYLGLAKKELNIDHPHLNETDTLIFTAINEIRNLSHSLIAPSLHESELLAAIDNIIHVTQKTSGIMISLQACGFDETDMPDKLKLSIYRIIQEHFNNILKHAVAQNIIVRLIQEKEKILLSIKDDGVGFDTTKKSNGVGLMNIKTRASLFNGDISIISSPGNGCELRVLFN